jgi:hypothetical protein
MILSELDEATALTKPLSDNSLVGEVIGPSISQASRQ